ncbi:hypothetical protein CRENBAI_011150 [Crenichthys baileyi]|uniref:Uncharacterized protein n=1 Tax=Crenichthys baileyi TaxID=28760 RepID=A0AAV9SBK1_9TELE
MHDALLPLTKVKLFYVEEEQISTVNARLPEKLHTIKGTLSIHQVIGAVEVKVMHNIGRNRFYWPLVEDKIWYTADKIVTLICPPQQVTSRHVQINQAVCEKLDY